MAYSVTSVKTTVFPETKTPIDTQLSREEIPGLASKTLLNLEKGEEKPLKKITTILHHLPSVAFETEAKGKTILQPTISYKTTSKKYRHSNKEAISPIGEKEKEKIKLTIKSFMEFKDCLELLAQTGWKISLEGEFALSPLDHVTPLTILEDRFNTYKEKFRIFLENKALHYDSKLELLANQDEVLTFEQSSAIVKEFTALHDERNKTKEEKIISTFKYILEFDEFLKRLGKGGWQVNTEGQFLQGPRGEFSTFEELREATFQPRKEKFLQYLEKCGYRYDSSCESIFKEDVVADMHQVESLISEFIEENENDKAPVSLKINYQHFPDFKDVKASIKMMTEYDELIRALKSFGWRIDREEETLLSPQGKPYSLKEMNDKWSRQKDQLLAQVGNDPDKLDQLFESMKDVILTKLVEGALSRMGLKYDNENKFFINGEWVQTVEETTIGLTLNELGLL